MIGSLGDLVAMPGMPSEPTIKKMIAENPDFPIIARGKNGVAYEFELADAFRFVIGLREKEEEKARAHQAEVRQLGLALLGEDALAASEKTIGLSPADHKALLESELLSIKLAVQRGELVRKAEIELAMGQFVRMVADRQATLPDRLAKRATVNRETLAALDRLIEADRKEVAAAMERMQDVAPVDQGDPAL